MRVMLILAQKRAAVVIRAPRARWPPAAVRDVLPVSRWQLHPSKQSLNAFPALAEAAERFAPSRGAGLEERVSPARDESASGREVLAFSVVEQHNLMTRLLGEELVVIHDLHAVELRSETPCTATQIHTRSVAAIGRL
eukprot:4293541-Prymnesium_polylepis.2